MRKYLLIEGVDCVGKSTQIKLLQEQFSKALFVQEPGFSPLGKRLRKIIFDENLSICERSQLLLFLADRAQLHEYISQTKHELIISDRGFISGMAYARGFEFDWLLKLNSFVLDESFGQKVAFIKADEDLLIHRLAQKSLDKIEQGGVKMLLNIQAKIEEILLKLNEQKLITYVQIDARLKPAKINKIIKEFLNDT